MNRVSGSTPPCGTPCFKRTLRPHLQMYIESENIVGHEQTGFRQYKSTEDQTKHLTQVINDTFQAKKLIGR
jgi:hypothetical protein